MQWITLIGDENFTISTIKSLKHDGSIECYDIPSIKGRYYVNFGEDHLFYDFIETTDDFADDLNKIPYKKPHFITMIYSSKECVRSVLQQDNFPTNIYIDNDYGLILPIREFIQQGMPLDKDDMIKQ